MLLDDRPPTITRPEGEGGRVVVLLVLGLALLAGGCYLAAYLAASDKVPVGTRVGGVDIGGHDPTAAATVLREGLADRAETPFTVVVNGRTLRVPPQQVGLGVDYTASVHAAGAQRSWSLSRLWAYYTGGDQLDPVKHLDQSRLATLVDRLDAYRRQQPDRRLRRLPPQRLRRRPSAGRAPGRRTGRRDGVLERLPQRRPTGAGAVGGHGTGDRLPGGASLRERLRQPRDGLGGDPADGPRHGPAAALVVRRACSGPSGRVTGCARRSGRRAWPGSWPIASSARPPMRRATRRSRWSAAGRRW